MKNTIIRSATIIATSAFILAGCGLATEGEPIAAPTIKEDAEQAVEAESVDAPALEEDAETEEKAASSEGGPGVYQAPLMSGGTATVAVPGTGPEDLEQFRKDAGVDPVGYLVVEVDNTEGTEEAMVFEAKVVDSEGKTYVYEEVMAGMEGWTGDNYDLMDRELELWDKYPYSTLPSAKNTVPLVGPEVPEDIVSVFVEYEQAERVGDL